MKSGMMIMFAIGFLSIACIWNLGVIISKKIDPLAQQIFILDHCTSKEVVPIKGQLMHNLILQYYQNKDKCKCDSAKGAK